MNTDAAVQGDTSAFTCPLCGGKTAVKDSRPVPNNIIRRRRLCLVCGHRVTTFEVEAKRYSEASGLLGLELIRVRAARIFQDISYIATHLEAMDDVADEIVGAKRKSDG